MKYLFFLFPLSSFLFPSFDETASYEKLLDKPFDELTVTEWEAVKQQSELIAA